MAITVFGHLNPDTDSVASAIVAAWYFTKKDMLATPAVLGSLNKETAFVLEKFGAECPALLTELADGQEVVIVDTNNPSELPDSLSKAKIVAVIDHHKLSGLVTNEPLQMMLEPVACTATVLYGLIKRDGFLQDMPQSIAGLMLAAIISDTLNNSSPTTTPEDTIVMRDLATFAVVDKEQLAEEMFSAKSDLSGYTGADLLTLDSKIYEMSGKKVRLSSLETTKPENALEMLTEISQAISEEKTAGIDAVFFFVIDIIQGNATVFAHSQDEAGIVQKAFGVECHAQGTAILEGVVSRKKQIVPPIEKAFA